METSIVEVISMAGVIAAMIGGFIARDRYITRTISEKVEKLHTRIDKVRDEHVRRDDLAGHIERFEKSVDEMKEEQRRTNERIDKILAKVSRGAV